jgi:hypothetical protein
VLLELLCKDHVQEVLKVDLEGVFIFFGPLVAQDFWSIHISLSERDNIVSPMRRVTSGPFPPHRILLRRPEASLYQAVFAILGLSRYDWVALLLYGFNDPDLDLHSVLLPLVQLVEYPAP